MACNVNLPVRVPDVPLIYKKGFSFKNQRLFREITVVSCSLAKLVENKLDYGVVSYSFQTIIQRCIFHFKYFNLQTIKY